MGKKTTQMSGGFVGAGVYGVVLHAYQVLVALLRGRLVKEAEADRYAAPTLTITKVHQ